MGDYAGQGLRALDVSPHVPEQAAIFIPTKIEGPGLSSLLLLLHHVRKRIVRWGGFLWRSTLF